VLRKKLAIALAILLAIFVPMGIFLWYSYRQAEREIASQIQLLARSTATRTNYILKVAHDELRALANKSNGIANENTVKLMREIVFHVIYLRELGMVKNGQLVCNDYEVFNPPVPVKRQYRKLASPGQIAIVEPTETLQGGKSVIINYRLGETEDYVDALIDPEIFCEFHRFMDLGDESGVFLLLDNKSVVSLGNMSPNALPQDLSKTQGMIHRDEQHVTTAKVENYPVLVAVAVNHARLLKQWRENLWLYLGAGLLLATVLLFWLFRFLQFDSSMEADLVRAIKKNEFELRYQAIVQYESLDCLGIEALLRWPHPHRGMIPPSVFIPTAENAGLSRSLTSLVFQQVKLDQTSWLAAKPERYIAINITAAELEAGWLEEGVKHLEGINPKQVVFELIESQRILGINIIGDAMQRLKAIGYRFALDDFGTGFNNLELLDKYSFDLLKIDRCFVQMIDSQLTDNMVDYIIGIGKAKKMKLLAEGVESPEQAEYLHKRGITEMQGYLFAREFTYRQFLDSYGANFNLDKDKQLGIDESNLGKA
jgi:sensor c-di-GMP phosphodiesterase-like protein